MGLLCIWGLEHEEVTDWPRFPVRAEAEGVGQGWIWSHGYEGVRQVHTWGRITQVAARAEAQVPPPWSDSSSPLVWSWVKAKGHIWLKEAALPVL